MKCDMPRSLSLACSRGLHHSKHLCCSLRHLRRLITITAAAAAAKVTTSSFRFSVSKWRL